MCSQLVGIGGPNVKYYQACVGGSDTSNIKRLGCFEGAVKRTCQLKRSELLQWDLGHIGKVILLGAAWYTKHTYTLTAYTL